MAQVEIKIKLMDYFTAPLKKMQSIGASVFSQMSARANTATNSLNGTTKSISSLRTEIESLKAKRDGLINEDQIRRANGELKKLNEELKRMENLPPKGFMSNMTAMQNGLGKMAGMLAGVFAFNAVKDGIIDIKNITAKVQGLQNALSIIGGSNKAGMADWEFLKATSQELGIGLEGAAEGYKTLAGATMGSKLAGEPTRKMFADIANAAGSMGLDVDAQKGVFLAMGQMLSKVKVSAEELNGQLGERMAGSLQQFAKSMGLTTAELLKQMQEGKVIAADVLPKFAAQMKEAYGSKGPVDSLIANQVRAENSILLLKVKIGSVLMPTFQAFYRLLGRIAEILFPMVDKTVNFFERSSKAIQENKTLIESLGIMITGIILAYIAYNAVLFFSTGLYAGLTAMQKIHFAYMIIQETITNALTASTWRLNLAFLASPVGWVVIGITALIAGLYYLYNYSEKTRGVLMGLWNVFISLLKIVRELFYAMVNLVTLDFGKMADNLKNVADLGYNMGSEYQKGVNEGIESFRQEAWQVQKEQNPYVVKKASTGSPVLDQLNLFQTPGVKPKGLMDGLFDSAMPQPDDKNKTGVADKVAGVSGDDSNKAAKIVNVRIEQIKVEVKAMMENGVANLDEMAQQVADRLVGIIHDASQVAGMN